MAAIGVVAAVAGASSRAASETRATAAPDALTVLFFGDSITAGYGLEPDAAFPALIERKIEERGWNVRVVNGGLSGDTTAAGVGRLRWRLRNDVDVLVLALGGNDGLRGVPPETMRANLDTMIQEAKKVRPDMTIVLAGMRMPANYGNDFTRRFAGVFPELATTHNIALIPFLLEGVGGVRSLNQSDAIHPTAEGQERIAETVWKVLEPILRTRLAVN